MAPHPCSTTTKRKRDQDDASENGQTSQSTKRLHTDSYMDAFPLPAVFNCGDHAPSCGQCGHCTLLDGTPNFSSIQPLRKIVVKLPSSLPDDVAHDEDAESDLSSEYPGDENDDDEDHDDSHGGNGGAGGCGQSKRKRSDRSQSPDEDSGGHPTKRAHTDSNSTKKTSYRGFALFASSLPATFGAAPAHNQRKLSWQGEYREQQHCKTHEHGDDQDDVHISAHEASLRCEPNAEETLCTACSDDLAGTEHGNLQCGHPYCRVCLEEMIKEASNNLASWPARCCIVINPEEITNLVSEELRMKYVNKTIEWSTSNRTYCHDPHCARFLNSSAADIKILKCFCQKETCTKCKRAAHEGPCAKEPLPEDLLALVNGNGWKRCPSCSVLVGISSGCNHMKCVCKAQFCYACGETWRHCSCELFGRYLLLDRGAREGAMIEQLELRQLRPEEFNNILNRIRAAGPTCTHTDLKRVERPGRCDECGDDLDKYLYRGCACALDVCLWCLKTRLYVVSMMDPRYTGGRVRRVRPISWWSDRQHGADNGVLSAAEAERRAERKVEAEERHRLANAVRQENNHRQRELRQRLGHPAGVLNELQT